MRERKATEDLNRDQPMCNYQKNEKDENVIANHDALNVEKTMLYYLNTVKNPVD